MRRASQLDVAADEAVGYAHRDVHDLRVFQDDTVLDLAILDLAMVVDRGKRANV